MKAATAETCGHPHFKFKLKFGGLDFLPLDSVGRLQTRREHTSYIKYKLYRIIYFIYIHKNGDS